MTAELCFSIPQQFTYSAGLSSSLVRTAISFLRSKLQNRASCGNISRFLKSFMHFKHQKAFFLILDEQKVVLDEIEMFVLCLSAKRFCGSVNYPTNCCKNKS